MVNWLTINWPDASQNSHPHLKMGLLTSAAFSIGSPLNPNKKPQGKGGEREAYLLGFSAYSKTCGLVASWRKWRSVNNTSGWTGAPLTD